MSIDFTEDLISVDTLRARLTELAEAELSGQLEAFEELELEQLREAFDAIDTLQAERDQLRAEVEALRPALALLRVMRTHHDESTGYKYPVSMWFPQIDALEAAMAAKEA